MTTRADTAEPSEPLVEAHDLSLIIRRAAVWRDLTFDFGPGLGVISGRTGSGRSSLLLSLVGRMTGVAGQLEVAGIDAIHDARRLRQATAVARVSTMIDLEPRLTVAESITERSLTEALHTDDAHRRMAELEDRIGQRFVRDRLVGELDAWQQTLLAASLAELRPARLMVLDDVDAGLAVTEQRRVFSLLSRLLEPDSAIVVSTRETSAVPPDAALFRLPDR